jgi:hypothetical protein
MADICASGTLIGLPAARISSKITFVSNKITNQYPGAAHDYLLSTHLGRSLERPNISFALRMQQHFVEGDAQHIELTHPRQWRGQAFAQELRVGVPNL